MEVTVESQRAMRFLREHLPQSDLSCYPEQLFQDFADHALKLREEAPWCSALDWEIFAHYVLFPRVNDEDLSFHRRLFYHSLWPRVKDLPTQEERVLEVNRWCHEHASYQAQDERTASPLTVYRNGSGRCGEESAFLVSALRSVGIPARQVYAPSWSHCDDNHAWVEALCGNEWRFLGACEPEPVLDRGWFTTAASRAMLVRSKIFGEGSDPLHGEFLAREGNVRWFNQTSRYAAVKTYTFQARIKGRPAPGAKFQLQILNEASFHTIAVLTAGSRGTATASLGLGSLHVLASLDGLTAEGDCCGDGITLQLASPRQVDTAWVDFDFHAPLGRPDAPAPLSAGQKAERASVLRHGDGLRKKWIAENGNDAEIQAFLSGGADDGRGRFLETLSEKDFRDVDCGTLEDHYLHLPPRPEGLPEEIYWRYAVCPRIALEKLTPWRSALKNWLKGRSDDPVRLWEWLKEVLRDERDNLFDNLYWPPAQIPEAGGCDGKSRKVLLIACLRTLGVPARLCPLDGEPEVWENGAFHPLFPRENGSLRILGSEGDWSLSRWTGDGWLLLHPENRNELVLPAGKYRLITSVRLPNGGQLASRREVRLNGGETKEIGLRLRECQWTDLLGSQPLPILAAETLDGERVPDLFRRDGNPALVLWLEEGGEPTEHLLNELSPLRRELDRLSVRVLLLIRNRGSVSQPTLARLLDGWSKPIALLPDDWAYDLETAARQLGRDPECAPLAVAADGRGHAVYSVSGYQVGSAAMLVRAAAYLCRETNP